AFYPYVPSYMIVFTPTSALVNSVSFNQMPDPATQFSFVRVFGPIGSLVAGSLIRFLNWDPTDSVAQGMLQNTFLLSAIASAVLGLYSFTLPKTPPKIDKDEKMSISNILGLDALSLLKDRNFLLFFVASVLICIPLAFYYQNASPF